MTLVTTRRSDVYRLLTMLHGIEMSIKLALLECLVHLVSNFLRWCISYLWDLISVFPYTPTNAISTHSLRLLAIKGLAWAISFDTFKFKVY